MVTGAGGGGTVTVVMVGAGAGGGMTLTSGGSTNEGAAAGQNFGGGGRFSGAAAAAADLLDDLGLDGRADHLHHALRQSRHQRPPQRQVHRHHHADAAACLPGCAVAVPKSIRQILVGGTHAIRALCRQRRVL